MAVGLWRTIDLAPKCRPARFPVGAAFAPRRTGFLWERRPRREERAPCGRGVRAAKSGFPVCAASSPRRTGFLWERRPRREERASCGRGVRAAKNGLPVGAASSPRRICAERSACSPYPVHSPAWFVARKERHRFNTSGKLRMSTHFFNPRPAAKALHTCRRAHA